MNDIKIILVWLAKIQGAKCKMCGKRMVDYNKLCRWLAIDDAWKIFHRKDGDGICYVCANSTCEKFQMAEFP